MIFLALQILVRVWISNPTKLQAIKQAVDWLLWADTTLANAANVPGGTAEQERYRITLVKKAIRQAPVLSYSFFNSLESTLNNPPDELTKTELALLRKQRTKIAEFQSWLAKVDTNQDVLAIRNLLTESHELV